MKALKQAIKKPELKAISKDKPFSLSAQMWDTGQVSREFAAAMFSAVKAKTQTIPLVLMPRIDLIKVDSGEAIGQQSLLMTPLVVEVLVNREGQLLPTQTTLCAQRMVSAQQLGSNPFC